MLSYDFSTAVTGQIFPFMLVFCRIGCILMLFPGFGESFVPQRIRLCLALLFTFLLYMPLAPLVPGMPGDIGALCLLMGKEILIGLFYGAFLHLLISIVEIGGSVVAIQTGLSNAMILNPTQAAQSALPSAFLGMVATTLIFVTGLDHFLFRGMVETYRVFPPGGALPLGDLSNSYARTLSDCFKTGVELGAPFLVLGLMLFTALGMIQRLMPQVQLFLVILPLQIWGGLALFSATLAMIMTQWLQGFDRAVAQFLSQGG